ncbi:MAG: Spx/MgsR family RNA polymerase-binding regulatory protein [Candidatus Methylacidiphilales bacterium]|nr:Spx/MgsR family RNA polymerase-binding regulatory protein [Candidatus Methylacidiphilales bacterium]
MLKVYVYDKCDTCRKALKFLRARGVEFREIPIRETPPSEKELRAVLAAQGGDLRRLFNTSGRDYRALGLKDQLPGIKPAEALALLAANGNLIRRPFAIGPGVGLVGFEEAVWKRALMPE